MGDISFTATNIGLSPITATITVTPTFTNGGKSCVGPSEQFTITVNPTAHVTDPADQIVCHLENITAVTFATDNTGGTVSYAWTNDTPSIGLAASGSGDIAAFAATNPTDAPVTATITVTPTFTNGGKSCVGPSEQFTITVNPTAHVTDPADQVVCNTESTSAIFGTNNTGGTVTYDWVNDNPAIGLAGSGVGDISFTATNIGLSPITATITVTPTFTNGGKSCVGPSEQFTITVNPTAHVTDPADQVVCNTESTSAIFGTNNTGGTVTYDWVNDNPAIGLAGSGVGDISFTATNIGLSPITATITVTPTFTNGGKSCVGPSEQFTITVNPTAHVTDPADQIVCHLENITAVTFATDNTGGTVSYAWTNDTPSIGLAASGSGDIAAFAATNPTDAPVTATITVTPTFTNGGKSCVGPSEQFTITVNPTAHVTDPADQVVCNTESTSAIFGTNNTGGTVTYDWVNDNSAIGLAGSGVGDISFTATNIGLSPITATITVTPTFTNGGKSCVGPSEQFTITVNPTAHVTDPADQIVCHLENITAVTFATDNTGGTVSYAWTNDTPSIGLAASGSGDIAAFAATNPTDAPVTATITVTPTFTNGGKSCVGPSEQFTITVNPTAHVTDPADQVVCNTESTSAIFGTNNTGGTVTYDWVNDNPAIGLAGSGVGDISFTATNIGLSPITATITVTPTFTNGGKSCVGPSEQFTITVNPTAHVFDPLDQIVCNGESTAEVVFGTNNTGGTVTYAWENDNPSIGLDAIGTGTIPSFIATNLNYETDTARITVNPTFSHGGKSCEGPPVEFLIIVNPTPRIEVEVPNDTICTDDVLTINVTNPNGSVEGDWEYILEVEYDESGDLLGDYTDPSYGPLSDPIIVDNLTNVGSTPLRVIYRFYPQINPSDGGPICEIGIMDSIIVIVDPSPAIRVNPGDTALCNNGVTSITIENPHIEVLGQWWYNLEITTDPLFPVTTSYDGDRDTIKNPEFTDTLVNPFADAHWIKYKFTPIYTYGDGVLCSSGRGEEDSVIIWVNPTPTLGLTPPDPEICSGGMIGLSTEKLNNPITGHVWKYDFSFIQEPPENGELNSVPTLENHPWTGDSAYSYTFTNSGNNAHRVTFSFAPSIEDPDGEVCYGVPISDSTIIYPVPQIDPSISDTLRCNDTEAFWEITTLNEDLYAGVWRYYLEVSEPTDTIDGESLSGDRWLPDGGIVRDTLFNTDINVHEVIYRFTPYIDHSNTGLFCSGSAKEFTLWVNPTPVIDVTLPDEVFCNNQVIPFTVLDSLFGSVSDSTSRQYEIYAQPDNPDLLSIFNSPSGDERYPSWPSPAVGSPDLLPVDLSFADLIVNNDSHWQDVIYLFYPYIYDEREGRKDPLCGPGAPVFRTIHINPTPDLEITVEDSIICNETDVRININDKIVTPFPTHKVVYGLSMDYETDSVDGIMPHLEDEFIISETLNNKSDTVQILDYQFVARLKDLRQVPPVPSNYCENITPITKRVKVNPTPRLAYGYENNWGRDILCYGDSGVYLSTDPQVYATNDIYYHLEVINDGRISGAIDPDPLDSIMAADGLDQRSIRNDSMNLGIVDYIFSPFISVEGCLGAVDTTTIKLNPNPVLSADVSKDKVCYSDGFEIPMSTPVGTTTGLMQYQLRTDNFTFANISGPVPAPGPYYYDTVDTLYQPIKNTGNSIEDITYYFTPVILNAREDLGDGGNCWGTPKEPILVEVAPSFKYNLVADTVWGGWEIRCNGESSLPVHPNLSGGYYRDAYTFVWDTVGSEGTYERLTADSIQQKLGVGEYEFYVVDAIGCDTSSIPVKIEEPPQIEITNYTITEAECAQTTVPGSIEVSMDGGTPGIYKEYRYFWQWEFADDSIEGGNFYEGGSDYHYLSVLDSNYCYFDTTFYIGSVNEIIVQTDTSDVFGYAISCNGESDGWIEIEVREGFAPYDIKVYPYLGPGNGEAEYAASSTVDEIIGLEANVESVVSGLPANEYVIFAYDSVGCYNRSPWERNKVTLSDPAPISIRRENIHPVFDTMDISCFGADDGVIELSLSGARTQTHPESVTYIWSGDDPDMDLVNNVRLQDALSGGTYRVIVRDTAWGVLIQLNLSWMNPPDSN